MSTKRYVSGKEQKIGTNGRKLCKVCEQPLPPRKQSYCSKECYYRNRPRDMRYLVNKRDKGVCSICNLKKPWQMDHIIPVCEGGGLCGLDGYRTLCNDCHKTETNKLKSRLKEKRKTNKA